MEFQVLGPFEVRDEGRPVHLGGAKQRGLLALLLLNPNRVVPVDVLIDGLWGDDPPESAAHSIQVYVSRLRKSLGRDGQANGGEGPRVMTKPPGYLLRVGPSELDLDRFEHLVTAGREALRQGSPGTASERLRSALDLWRDAPFAEFRAEPFARAAAVRMEELRASALDDRIDAELELGRHGSLVAELQALVLQHPFRERTWKQLILALYRSERQAEALQAFAAARRVLGEELGIDPSLPLQRLERAILVQDPELDWRPPRPAGHGVDAPRPPEGSHDGLPPSNEAPTQPAGIRAGWKAIIAATVAAVVAGATTIVVKGSSGGSPRSVPVAAPANSVAIIDPATNSLVGTIPIKGVPGRLAIGGNSVWAAGMTSKTLFRIDPKARKVEDTVRLGATPTDLASGTPDSIWAATGLTNSAVEVTPGGTGTYALKSVALGSCCAGPSLIDTDRGVIWTGGPSGLKRIDPQTHSLAATVSVAGAVAGMAHVGPDVWVTDGWDTVSRISPLTGGVTARIRLPLVHGEPPEPTSMAVGHGQAWLVESHAGRAGLLDAGRGRVTAAVPVGRGPSAIAFGAGAFWVANSIDGTVSRIDPRIRRVVATIRVGHRLGGIAVGDGDVWVSVQPVEATRLGGKIAYDDRSDIYTMNADGTGVTRLTHAGPDEENVEPRWSPDGTEIAFTSSRGPARTEYHHDIYVMNADGSGVRRLTRDLDWVNTDPVWSPDSTRIAFHHGHVRNGSEAGGDVYVMNADGTGRARLTRTPRPDASWPYSWSPNGRDLVTTSCCPGGIYTIDVATGAKTPVVTAPGWHPPGVKDDPAWSPSGTIIAYSDMRPFPGVYVTNATGRGMVKVADLGGSPGQLGPTWSRDGARIAFGGVWEQPYGIYVMNADGTGLVKLLFDAAAGDPNWQPTT